MLLPRATRDPADIQFFEVLGLLNSKASVPFLSSIDKVRSLSVHKRKNRIFRDILDEEIESESTELAHHLIGLRSRLLSAHQKRLVGFPDFSQPPVEERGSSSYRRRDGK